LYLPEKVSGKIPAVVVVHAHHAPKVQVELQDLGMTLARSGTAVLIMDQINGGERSQTQPWARESYHGRYTTGNQLYLAGESLIKWMAWDIMRGVDVLLERSYIDPERIVLLGGVAGGGDPAALTGNLDHRIAAVIPFCFGEASPEAHYLQGPRKYDNDTADPGWAHWETTRNLPHSVSKQFFPWFLCAAGAPRPFIFSFELAWPGTVEEEPVWARYKKVYDLYGARNHLAEVDGLGPFPGPGETNQISTYLRQRIDTILNRWFQLPLPKSEYHKMLAESDLLCLTPAAALEFKPEPVSNLAMQLALKRLADSRARRAGLVAAERKRILRNDLEKKLGDIVPVTDPSVRALWSRQYSGFTMEASSIETEEGITLPVFLLIPKNSLKRRAAVIAVAEGGKEGFLTERADELSSLLAKGITVCLPDLRGMGELNDLNSRGPRGMDLAANVLMTGSTMTGARLKDTRTVLQWLSNRSDIDTTKIGVWGDSFAEPNAPDFNLDQSPGQKAGPVAQRHAEPLGPFLALLTALYEDHVSVVAASGGLISFMSVLEDRFSHVPQDVIVPGMLTVTDLGEIASLIAPRPLLLRKMVDGRNKLVPVERMEKEYGRKKSNLILRENAGDEASLATWLLKNLK
ncbi:MAG: acetylxylan esterase, partial [Chryseosolibacter sp.]